MRFSTKLKLRYLASVWSNRICYLRMPAAAIWFSGRRYVGGWLLIVAGIRYLGLLQLLLSIGRAFSPKPKFRIPGRLFGSYRLEEN